MRTCECKDPGIFDIRGQIYAIFRQSNIMKLKKVDSLLGFQFWKVGTFWCLFAFLAWLPITWLIVKYWIPEKCKHSEYKALPVEKRTK